MDVIEEIVLELKKIAKNDYIFAKETEKEILKLLKTKPNLVYTQGKKLVHKIYEDKKMRQTINKTNILNKSNSYMSKTSKIGRINRKKALFDMTWILKQNRYKLNYKELFHFIEKLEKNLILPDDYNTFQTAKIRDQDLYIKDGKVYFKVLENGKIKTKAIKFLDNSVIVLGKNYVFRIKDNILEDDKIKAMHLLPLDTIFYSKDNILFIWKNDR